VLAGVRDGEVLTPRLPVHVMDPSTQGCPNTVIEILAMAQGMKPRPALIVIDNLGELGTREKHRERDLGVMEKMQDLRRAKNVLQIPILTLAHPNNEALKGTYARRLRGSDIAGGAPAERICDGVILMHREDKHPTCDHSKEAPVAGLVELYSSKVRGLSERVYCEVMAVAAEHRFSSRLNPDADPFMERPSYETTVRELEATVEDRGSQYQGGEDDPFVDRPAPRYQPPAASMIRPLRDAVYEANHGGGLPDDGVPAFEGENGNFKF
jgi:hypothetical protein